MFMELIHKKPPPNEVDENNPHNILLVYLHELKKLDQFRRRLRGILGEMEHIERTYINHSVNANIRHRPDIKNCVANMHLCARRWFKVRSRFHFLARYKHYYVQPGGYEKNPYQIEPKVMETKRR
jgi:hypothetical protein